jgi:hypothetical protein
LAIKDKFEGFSKKQKKKIQGEGWVWREERKDEKRKVRRKSREIP